jgi:flagellar biogenesis protein FliO
MHGLAAQTAMAGLYLGAVLLLILGAARLARRLPALRAAGPGPQPITLIGSLALDRTHRLHLVQVGDHRTLVLTGGQGALTALAPPE